MTTVPPRGLATVHRGLVPVAVCEAALGRLWLEVRRHGLTVQEIAEWSTSTWFPWLRTCREIQAVQDHLSVRDDSQVRWAEPQILIRLPDEPGTALGPPHTDTLPPWANPAHWRYRAVYGVELTQGRAGGGGTVLHPDGREPVETVLSIGDVLVMHPDLPHSGSPNRGPTPRVALFFRLLERA